MARFNSPTQGSKTVNLAGGEAYKQSPELELVSILLTSFANDQFYRKAEKTFDTLKDLIRVCDPKFVAQAAIYARTQFGMRSISHVVASELAKRISTEPWAKSFYNAIVYRPDDMMEILSYHLNNKQKIPNSMKRGFSQAFSKFDRYQLAKYRGEGKGVKLVDVVNLIHPKPTEKNADAIKALVNGDLKSFDTWETELTKAGQVAVNDEEKAELKKEVWVRLIQEKKIGYFALLRNLRNIAQQAPEILTEALSMLVNEQAIRKSLVLPFRFTTAYEEIKTSTINGSLQREIMVALNKAVDISLANVPVFTGRTLVVLDVSGSMEGRASQIGSLFAAVLCKSNNCDFLIFDTVARYVSYMPTDSTMTLANGMHFSGGGTNFHCIFPALRHSYDRIIILSDMQGWVGYNTPAREYNEYKSRTSANPFIYSFDLVSHGDMQFPERNVYCLAGFSDKIFDIMALLETDRQALINTIKQVAF